MSDEPEHVYRTTNTLRCPICGAQPGESCHFEPGRFGGVGESERFHLGRIDPESEPVGMLAPADPRFPYRQILPLPQPTTEGEASE